MNMATCPESHPRLLLVEDDPISSGFLQAVLEGLPATVDCADSLSSASTAHANVATISG